jgi:hypothetical protein
VQLIPEILEELQKFMEFFERNRRYEFIGSSILFCFDADPDQPYKVKARMIDFAHVQIKPGERDEGYLHGLKNLVAILKQLYKLSEFSGDDLGVHDMADRPH